MDSMTQAALGATLGGAVLSRPLGRKALIGGAVLGTLPDLDVLIDHGSAIADFTYHRGFSHSLFVLAILATCLAWLLRRLGPGGITLSRWWWFCALPLLTHPMLDAFTTYGTQLLWPLQSPPVAWNTIFIIDPLYTLPLLVAAIIGLWRPPARRAIATGLILSSAYLGWTVVAKHIVAARVSPIMVEHHWQDDAQLIQPMPLTSLLWRVVVRDGDTRREAYVSLLDAQPPRFDTFETGPWPEPMWPELKRLAWFTGGQLSFNTRMDNTLVATDDRMGVPGHHPFRFAVARQTEGGVTPIPSYTLDSASYNGAFIARVLKRITDPSALCPADDAPDETVRVRHCRP
ncbi:metal-dependent hydrolase [Larsenimonas salina]|uniref:metal-dependent hydrolase n=1 Tax=Larsenimonas salina TaxID=1295565 RepID=UPI00207378BB|nr:metal-dependent hydrolase [Larsenimonas salina]MCM5704315.1 metal-dependent hydrolase [Larsenimonas salina]